MLLVGTIATSICIFAYSLSSQHCYSFFIIQHLHLFCFLNLLIIGFSICSMISFIATFEFLIMLRDILNIFTKNNSLQETIIVSPHGNHVYILFTKIVQDVYNCTKCTQDIQKMYPTFWQIFVYILYTKLKKQWQLKFVYKMYTKVCPNMGYILVYIHFVYIHQF